MLQGANHQRARTLVLLALVLLECVSHWPAAWAVRRPARSVIQCDSSSRAQEPLTDEASCRRHCERTYVDSSRELRQLNKSGLWQARMMHALRADSIGQRVHLLHHPEQQARHQHHAQQQNTDADAGAMDGGARCCCLFEAPWPQWVAPAAIDRELDQKIINDKFWDKRVCMPLVMAIGLSKRTRDSYEGLCRHLKERNPLTMLELMEFVESGAYLNYMEPKHPSIMLVLREKHVKRLQKAEAQELRRALYDYLLDDTYYGKQLVDLPGYRFELTLARRLAETKRELPNALKVKAVYRAFEELAISQVLMDVAAAGYRVRELNFKHFRLPENLMAGDYDKYDTDLGAYFTLAPGQLDCRLLGETRHRLEVYLSSLKSTLGPFREKAIYEHMADKFAPLRDLGHAQKVYANIDRVNCRPAPHRA